MEQLVSTSNAALYNMAEPITLGPLPEDAMSAHLAPPVRPPAASP